jgi:hypothetical protein
MLIIMKHDYREDNKENNGYQEGRMSEAADRGAKQIMGYMLQFL